MRVTRAIGISRFHMIIFSGVVEQDPALAQLAPEGSQLPQPDGIDAIGHLVVQELPQRRLVLDRDVLALTRMPNSQAIATTMCAWILAVTSPLPCFFVITDATWSVTASSLPASLASISVRRRVP